ncbi:nuclease domain-containing protein [Companilactobacillus sp.]|uniref:nuclease domain-containing protein n=1 Tax=Companilactobacillus sp. TaxID=2767905 RepID=UPI0026119C22|nr:nuclease domain-containing protein [Companilactobacillus sp.]
MDSQFKVFCLDALNTSPKSKKKTTVVEVKPTNDKSCFDPRNKIPKIIESNDFTILFTRNNDDDKIYLDDLENNQSRISIAMNKYPDLHLLKKTEEIKIFDKTTSKSALTPGLYGIRIISNGEIYYCAFEIVLKGGVSDSSWFKMREEIDEIVYSLSQNSEPKENIWDVPDSNYSNNDMNSNFLVDDICHNFSKLDFAIRQVAKHPKFVIDKKYTIETKKNCPQLDSRVVRHQRTHIENPNKRYSFHKNLNYDIKSNQCIKFILEYMDKVVFEQAKDIRAIFNDKTINLTIDRKSEFQKKLKKIMQLRSTIQMALYTSVFSAIKSKNINIIPKTIMLNPNYRTIYQQYQNMHFRRHQLKVVNSTHLNRRPTNEIYEIWGYFTLIRLLMSQNVGFKRISDNLDSEFGDGTNFVLKKDEITLKIIYNQSISKDEKGQFHSLSRHNKPDIILNVKINDKYVGSIILDTKYKTADNALCMHFRDGTLPKVRSNPYEDGSINQYFDSNDVEHFKYYRSCIVNKGFEFRFQNSIRSVISVYGLVPNSTCKYELNTTKKERLAYSQIFIKSLNINEQGINNEKNPSIDSEYISEDLIKTILNDIDERISFLKTINNKYLYEN